jgi:fatty-acyl-CoA synthase
MSNQKVAGVERVAATPACHGAPPPDICNPAMNWRIFWDDLRQLPLLARLGAAMRQASDSGRDTLATLVREQAQTIPDRTLLRFETETVSYGDFNAGANAFAAVFKEAGIGREPVALMMQNSPALLMAEAAVAKSGAIGALINTHLSEKPLAHALLASNARHVFVDHASLPRVVDLPDCAGLNFWAEGDAAELPPHIEPLTPAIDSAPRSEPDALEVRGGDVFLYIYTSGTTGLPKPAIIRHSRFTMAGIGLGALLGIGADDVIYAPLPLYHGESNFVGFSTAIRAGGCFASRRRFSAGEFLGDVRRHGATAFVYVGELCRYLLRQPPTPHDRDHHLRLAAGAGLRPDIWECFQERFGIKRIVEMYGMTEGNVNLMNLSGRVGSVGRPHAFQHHLIRLARYDVSKEELLRDKRGFLIPCEVGEVGELLGRITRKGYMPYEGYTDRAASEAKTVHNAFRRGDHYFRTGDLLRRDERGYYYFVDRIGDTFRWKGENVSTQEVAEFLNRAQGVIEANVYGVEVPGHEGRAGTAALVVDHRGFDGVAFYRHAQRQLPTYAVPVFVRLVDAIETTGTLKQRKLQLQREGFDLEVIKDPIYLRDDEAGRYVPFTRELAGRLRSGTLRL